MEVWIRHEYGFDAGKINADRPPLTATRPRVMRCGVCRTGEPKPTFLVRFVPIFSDPDIHHQRH
jgi:hypothetical protein